MGARCALPDHTSSVPPSPIKIFTEGRAGALSTIHFSCVGYPKQTKTISGLFFWIILTTIWFSSPFFLKYPWCVPQILIFGKRFFIFFAAFFATPFFAPKRKILYFFFCAIFKISFARSIPLTRHCILPPFILEAITMPIPSGIFISAHSKSLLCDALFCAQSSICGFGVNITVRLLFFILFAIKLYYSCIYPEYPSIQNLKLDYIIHFSVFPYAILFSYVFL